LISLISDSVAGNIAGAGMKDKIPEDPGPIGNSIADAFKSSNVTDAMAKTSVATAEAVEVMTSRNMQVPEAVK